MDKNDRLPTRQGELLEAIRSFISHNHESPTVSELAETLGGKSPRTISEHLDALEKKGFIARDPFKKRNIRLLSGLDTLNVPIIASAGCDQLNVLATQEFEGYLSVDPSFGRGRNQLVAIRAIGNSMKDAGIHNGDFVLVERMDTAENGARVVAIVGDMAVIKKIMYTPDAMILHPEAEGMGYTPIVMRQDFRIFGRVVSVIPMSTEVEPDMEIVPIEGHSY